MLITTYNIARNTFRECLRQPIYIVLLLTGLSIIGTYPIFSWFVFRAQEKLVVDGSMATIIYTTMGHTGLAKERVEAYAGGISAVLDDYVSLKFYGAKHGGWTGGQAAQGHLPPPAPGRRAVRIHRGLRGSVRTVRQHHRPDAAR